MTRIDKWTKYRTLSTVESSSAWIMLFSMVNFSGDDHYSKSSLILILNIKSNHAKFPTIIFCCMLKLRNHIKYIGFCRKYRAILFMQLFNDRIIWCQFDLFTWWNKKCKAADWIPKDDTHISRCISNGGFLSGRELQRNCYLIL